MSRTAKLISLCVVFASTLAWAVARDNYVAIERVPFPTEPRTYTVTVEGYPIRVFTRRYENDPEGPEADDVQWNGDAGVAYVSMLAGPAVLVMEDGDGPLTVAWFPRTRAGDTCLTDFELEDRDLRVIDHRRTTRGCESSMVRVFRIYDYGLHDVATSVLFPSVVEAFGVVPAHGMESKSKSVPLISAFEQNRRCR